MQNFIGYMFFSFIEGCGAIMLMFGIFRINITRFLFAVIILNFFINLQSFFFREEVTLAAISPIINITNCILFLTIFVRIPFIWSTVVTLTGIIALGLIQTTFVFFSFGYFSIAEIQEVLWKEHAVQAITGSIACVLGYSIYRLGYGFTFEFEKLRFKWERILIISLIIAFLIAFIIVIVYRSMFSNLLVFAIALVIFLIFSLWKDSDE